MQFIRKNKTIIVLGIGVLFILYGILDWIFKFKVSQQTVNNVGMLLMIAAFGLLYSGRKPKQNSSDETEMNSIQETTNEADENNQLQNKNEVSN